MYLNSADKISTINIGCFKSSKNLLRLPLHTGEKNHLNAVSISNSVLEHQFLRIKKVEISAANIIFKFLEKDIKL